MDSAVKEHSLFDSITDDVVFQQKCSGDCSFKVPTISDASVTTNNEVDFDLACYISTEVEQQAVDVQRRVLVLNCGMGLAGSALLQKGYRPLTMVDRSAAVITSSTWKCLFLNAPDCMSSVRCLSTGCEWLDLSQEAWGRVNRQDMAVAMLFLIVPKVSNWSECAAAERKNMR